MNNEKINALMKLAQQGDGDAMYELSDYFYKQGLAYMEGKGVEKNEDKAVMLMEEAAKLEHEDAQWDLGQYYYQCAYSGEKTQEEIVSWLVRAAQYYCHDAQYDLGCRYYDGDGVLQNYEEAVRWWHEAAASSDDPNTATQLANCYANGLGVEQDC